jgi:hypothetical protein
MQAALIAVSNAQGGVFTAQQAVRAGYSRDEIRARLRSGRWVRQRRGIFRPSGEVDERLVRIAAAVLACSRSRAVASHTAAAHLHGLPTLTARWLPELTVAPSSGTTAVKGCLVHRAALPPPDRVRARGVPTTSLARTVVDLARAYPFADGVVAADRALRAGVPLAELVGVERRAASWPGSGSVRRVLAFADGRAETPGESLARVVLAEHQIPRPQLGAPIWRGGRLLGVVDFHWPEHDTVVEFDGKLKYRADNDRGADVLWQEKRREEGLREAGLEVVRVTWDDVTLRGATVADRVRRAFARAHRARPVG